MQTTPARLLGCTIVEHASGNDAASQAAACRGEGPLVAVVFVITQSEEQ